MLVLLFIAGGFISFPGTSWAKEASQQWELVNPEGVVTIAPMSLAPRLSALEGKTVVLRWNGKPNGNILLDRVAELFTEKVKDVKVVKAYEMMPETSQISHSSEKGQEYAKKLLSLKPDIVIGSLAD
jgi:ABC-type Fe3+-hydroxamate transport system substrate-binding protein